MPLHFALFLLTGLLILALLLKPLAEHLGLPFAIVLIAVGFAGSELLVGFGVDTGLRADSFHDLIFYVFLPVLIFESAFKLDARLLLRNLLPILIIAVPVMLLSSLVTAVLVYYGIGHPGDQGAFVDKFWTLNAFLANTLGDEADAQPQSEPIVSSTRRNQAFSGAQTVGNSSPGAKGTAAQPLRSELQPRIIAGISTRTLCLKDR
jgi:hypothetical protein